MAKLTQVHQKTEKQRQTAEEQATDQKLLQTDVVELDRLRTLHKEEKAKAKRTETKVKALEAKALLAMKTENFEYGPMLVVVGKKTGRRTVAWKDAYIAEAGDEAAEELLANTIAPTTQTIEIHPNPKWSE